MVMVTGAFMAYSAALSAFWHSFLVHIGLVNLKTLWDYTCVYLPVKRQHNYARLDDLWMREDHRALSIQGCGVFNMLGEGSPSTGHLHL